MFINREVREIICLVESVCVSVCLFMLSRLNRLTFDLDFSHDGGHLILRAFNMFQGQKSRSKVKVKVKISFSTGAEWSMMVLALPSAAKSPTKQK